MAGFDTLSERVRSAGLKLALAHLSLLPGHEEWLLNRTFVVFISRTMRAALVVVRVVVPFHLLLHFVALGIRSQFEQDSSLSRD